MSRRPMLRRCPLRMAMNPLGAWPAWECIGRNCAWWMVESEQCALSTIALWILDEDSGPALLKQQPAEQEKPDSR